ncbi:MAG: DEAD/DEAH box helicase [Chloroflexota bacterium]|nr:DEAD/DEAH box helicase [Chloroflexota bacterium]
MSDTTFADLQLSEGMLATVADFGYEAPTPIQEQTIRLLIEGRDVIAQAQTGTGKTAAFAIPIVECVDPERRVTQALVLAPTRELAVQVAEAVHRLGHFKKLSVLPVYGGQPIERQLHALSRGVHVVIGTPGRVLDHLRRGTLQLGDIKYVVLDEADEMLDMGFLEDIESILDSAPPERQMALFSATIPPRIAALAQRYLHDPVQVTVQTAQMSVPTIEQFYLEVTPRNKLDALTRVLDHEEPESAMIFARTKRDVDELGEALQSRGFDAETLHGDLNQTQRDRVLQRFRGGQVDLLVATQVAARGLDITGVTHVFNYAIPEDAESYVHRIGRTGRAGRAGKAITLVQPNEIRWLRVIERIIGQKITPMRLPTLVDIEARRREAMKVSIREKIAAGNLLPFMQMVTELAEEFDLAEIAAAAAKMASDGERPLTVMVEPAQARTISDGVERGMVRLVMNVGREAGVRPGDIVGAIANEAGIPGRAIGAIDIYDRVAFVEVPASDRDQVIDALRNTTIKGRKLQVEAAEGGNGKSAPPPGPRQFRTPSPRRADSPDGERGGRPGRRSEGRPYPSRRDFGGAAKPRRRRDA